MENNQQTSKTENKQIILKSSNKATDTKWIRPKFDCIKFINDEIIKYATLAPQNSALLSQHINEYLATRSSKSMLSPDLLCYNEWYFD